MRLAWDGVDAYWTDEPEPPMPPTQEEKETVYLESQRFREQATQAAALGHKAQAWDLLQASNRKTEELRQLEARSV